MGAVILFHQIVEVFYLPEFTIFWNMSCCLELVESFGVRDVFVHVDDSWFAGMRSGKRFEKEVLGRVSHLCLS